MKLAKRAIKNFPTTFAGKPIARSNQRKWLAAVKVLGDKWILLGKVERKTERRMA